MERFVSYAAVLVTGVFLGCSFPPIGPGFLAWFALIPLLIWMEGKRPLAVYGYVFLTGLVFHAITISWIRHITWAGMITAVLALSAIFAIPFWIASFVSSRWPRHGIFILPFAVAGIEWIRSFDVLAFPWVIFGNSQAAYWRLIQFADCTSVFGISWWVVMVNVVGYRFARHRSVGRFAFIVLSFIVPLAYSAYVLTHQDPVNKKVTVSLIQGNIYPDEKWEAGKELWNIELYNSMSVGTMKSAPDLFVWPETAAPVYLCQEPGYLRIVQSMVDSTGIPLLTGTPSINVDSDIIWNSACFLQPYQHDIPMYDKIHLVPFGEAIPFDNLFPSLKKIDFGQANWDEGKRVTVFKPETLPPFNVAICFESIFPDLMRKFVVKGSQFFVVITNDVWFGPISSPIQHAMISAIRAIEFHRTVARCANTGISMVIDRYGRILSRTGTFERTTLVDTIEPNDRMTFYARFGNIFSIMCFAITVIVLVISMFVHKQGTERTE
jgi:apolipoprotein N-acyltransferase